MAKRRTKKQKIKARSLRLSVSGQDIYIPDKNIAPKKQRTIDFGYDVDLLKNDLFKTIGVSLVILVIEIILYTRLS